MLKVRQLKEKYEMIVRVVQEYGKNHKDGLCKTEVWETLGWVIGLLPFLTLFEFLSVYM